jgi:myo-inositol-1(or 4)-monophosphatase
MDGSPVSEIDLSINDLIREFLVKNFENILIISEEDTSHSELESSGYIAVVDPLDGTENFISGIPIWGISISLWKNKSHIDSVLYFPELRIQAEFGKCARTFNSDVVAISSSLPFNFLIPEFNNNSEVRIIGCATYALYLVSTGRIRKFININGANSWDILAGINIAICSGCEVLIDGIKYAGEFLNTTKKYTVEVSWK